MKIVYFSDLHIEFQDWAPPELDADVVILAGDIHVADKGIKWALTHFKQPVVYVLGNHEYYCRLNMEQLNDALIQSTKDTNIHVLIDEAVQINGVNFVGTTLWSDFSIYQKPKLNMTMALGMINDYRLITVPSDRMINRKFTPSDALALHKAALLKIESALAKDIPNVVISHFGIHEKCTHPQFHSDDLTGAFISDLTEFISLHEDQITAWIYGHTHHNCDFKIGKVPIITNQRGYAPNDFCVGFESEKYILVNDK